MLRSWSTQGCCVAGSLALLILAAGSPSQATPIPALEYRFFDAVGSMVPNHGSLGAAGNATLSGGAAVGPGGEAFDPGKSGVLKITSGGNLLSAPDFDSLDLATNLTYSYWVRPTNTSGGWLEMLGDCTTTSANHGSWYSQAMDLGTRNRAIVLVGYEAGGPNVYHYSYSGDNWIIPNQWQQLTVVLKNIGVTGAHTWTAEFYRNGLFHSSFTSPSTNFPMKNTADGFKIGNTHWDPSLLAQYGLVSVFDTALTADEVQAYYFTALPEPSSLALFGLGAMGLIVYLRRRG